MIDIDTAIEQLENKKNISVGGSDCFDFGDSVLVKYFNLTKYLKDGKRSREKSEEIMEAIKIKADNGVNTPRHLAIKRVVEGEYDVCYVLQQKCPGINCATIYKSMVSFEEMYESLKFVLNIPFEHYKKLIEDGLSLFEMGYEAKNKNLFYDSNSGFWYIDFLDNETNYKFDPNDIKKVFEALKYRIPKPLQIASNMGYGVELPDEQENKKNELEYAIKAKTLLAIKSILPNFDRYEKFFLFKEEKGYKEYLMKEGIVKKDLLNIQENDYEVFEELYEEVINKLINEVLNGEEFWSIECNSIKNESGLFNLQSFFEKSKYNNINISDFEDEYDYEREVDIAYKILVLTDLVNRLKQLNQNNNNVIQFLQDAETAINLYNQSRTNNLTF
ncbi:MAG: hypothetical protein E7170_00890 [Firmicutes bacterium]|nr:hypothetical protein [Bacillota bacterium]